MITMDNPAGRLYKILEEAKKGDPNSQTLVVWSIVFGIEPQDKMQLFHYMVQVNQLYRETIDSINSLASIDKELYLKHLPSIESVIGATNLDMGWNAYVGALSEVTMHSLAICSDTLSRQGGERLIEPASLEELSKEIDDLIKAVENSDIDDTIKIVILDQAEMIRRAIFNYKLRGAKGLKEALEASIMALMRNHELFNTESKKEGVQLFVKILDKLNKKVSVALTVAELTFGAVKLLEYIDKSGIGK